VPLPWMLFLPVLFFLFIIIKPVFLIIQLSIASAQPSVATPPNIVTASTFHYVLDFNLLYNSYHIEFFMFTYFYIPYIILLLQNKPS
jgi:hypothetical protein